MFGELSSLKLQYCVFHQWTITNFVSRKKKKLSILSRGIFINFSRRGLNVTLFFFSNGTFFKKKCWTISPWSWTVVHKNNELTSIATSIYWIRLNYLKYDLENIKELILKYGFGTVGLVMTSGRTLYRIIIQLQYVYDLIDTVLKHVPGIQSVRRIARRT